MQETTANLLCRGLYVFWLNSSPSDDHECRVKCFRESLKSCIPKHLISPAKSKGDGALRESKITHIKEGG